MARLPVLLFALLGVAIMAGTAGATSEADRLAIGTDAERHAPDEPVRVWVENQGETVFYGTVEVEIHRVAAHGACEGDGYDADCPRVASLSGGHVVLEPGERLSPVAVWETVDRRGRAQAAGTYEARLSVYDVEARLTVDEARFELGEGSGPGPAAGLLGPQPGATYTRSLAFSWWAQDPDGLRGINTSLLDQDGLGAIFLDHRGPEHLPNGSERAYGGGSWSIAELGRLGDNQLGFWMYDRAGESTQVALFDVALAVRNVSFEPERSPVPPGGTVRLNVTNTGIITLEGPARWNVSGHGNPAADGWVHRAPTHRFDPLAPGETRQLTWEARQADGTPAPPGEYVAYLGIRGHLARTTFEIAPGDAPSHEPPNETVPEPNATAPPGNVTVPIGANASLTARNATLETHGGTGPGAQEGQATAEATVRFQDGHNGSLAIEGGVTARQGERNVLLEDGTGRRVLVVAPTGEGRIHAGGGHLAVTGSDRAIIRTVDPADRVDGALVPAWLDGKVGARIDARGADPTVRGYGALKADPAFVEDRGRPALEVTLNSSRAEGRIVVIDLPQHEAWRGNLSVVLDDAEVDPAEDLDALVNASGEDPAWVLVDQEGERTLVVAVDHFSTRTLTIAPTSSLGLLPFALAVSFLLAVAIIVVLGRD